MTRDERVADILRAARDVFCEKGYEQTAVSEIAARIGVVEGTIYKYRSEEHTSELQSLMRISYAVFCLKKKKTKKNTNTMLTYKYKLKTPSIHLLNITRTTHIHS